MNRYLRPVVGVEILSKFQKLVFVVVLGLSAQLEAAQWRKASDWEGMAVVTSDGDNVGKVEDFALDLESGEVNYVVVSVGSFLIKDALIAVAPSALVLASGRLVISADSVADAKRFGEDSWPIQADVLAGTTSKGVNTTTSNSTNAGVQAGTSLPSSGVATISSNRRTATLSADERRIEDVQPAVQAAASSAKPGASASAPAITRVANGPLPSFGTLDKNRNGVLNRREIGSWLTQSDSYDDVDLDSSGTVDRFEFDIFAAQRK